MHKHRNHLELLDRFGHDIRNENLATISIRCMYFLVMPHGTCCGGGNSSTLHTLCFAFVVIFFHFEASIVKAGAVLLTFPKWRGKGSNWEDRYINSVGAIMPHATLCHCKSEVMFHVRLGYQVLPSIGTNSASNHQDRSHTRSSISPNSHVIVKARGRCLQARKI